MSDEVDKSGAEISADIDAGELRAGNYVPDEIDLDFRNFAFYSAASTPGEDEQCFEHYRIGGFRVAPPPGSCPLDGTWLYDGASKRVKFVPSYFHLLPSPPPQFLRHLPVDEEALRAEGAISAHAFAKLALEFAMTKEQWAQVPVGTQVVVLAFDQKWQDLCLDVTRNPRGLALDANHMFRELFRRVAPVPDLRSHANAHHHMLMTNLEGNDEVRVRTQVAYHRDETGQPWWHSIVRGALPARVLGHQVSWQDLAGNTLIGYRGPLIPVEALNSLPSKVYWANW